MLLPPRICQCRCLTLCWPSSPVLITTLKPFSAMPSSTASFFTISCIYANVSESHSRISAKCFWELAAHAPAPADQYREKQARAHLHTPLLRVFLPRQFYKRYNSPFMSSLMYFILTSANVLGVIALFILTAAYVSVHPYETLSTHFSIKTFTVSPTYCSRYSCSDSLPTAISSPALRLFRHLKADPALHPPLFRFALSTGRYELSQNPLCA